MAVDRTRYQILFRDNTRPIENFTASQKRALNARTRKLRADKIEFTLWDTQRNSLSRLFRI